MPGIFYVVAVPIGNLQDITLRALSILKEVDLVLSEDTRETSKLLKSYEIENKQLSYRDQNHPKIVESILNALKDGLNIALVSDAGTPLISDPGFKLIEELHKHNIKIRPIPGASSITAALSVGGVPTDKFSYLGFLPKTTSKRKELLTTFGDMDATLIILESPYRTKNLIEEIEQFLGNRVITIARELTKLHEEVITDYVYNVRSDIDKLTLKGEIIILVAKDGYELSK